VLHQVSKGSVRQLLEASANLWASDNQGLTPIHWAAGCTGRDNILEILVRFHEGAVAGEDDQSALKQLANQPCRCYQFTPLH